MRFFTAPDLLFQFSSFTFKPVEKYFFSIDIGVNFNVPSAVLPGLVPEYFSKIHTPKEILELL